MVTVRARWGLGLVVVLAVLLLGPAGAASAQTAPPTPAPYGGVLDRPAQNEQITWEQVLEVGMLVIGSVNGLIFAGAVIHSRVRGTTHAATRRALMARTGPGKVSETPRRRTPVAQRS